MMCSEFHFSIGGAVTADHCINVLAARRSKGQRGQVEILDASMIFKNLLEGVRVIIFV
jgi:hypothetical protein